MKIIMPIQVVLSCCIFALSVVFNLRDRFVKAILANFKSRRIIMWTTPAATEMRFGFEVTMYVMNK